MSSREPVFGSATVEEFFYWINERHKIYLKRADQEPKPWTDDPILRDYKFTNAFRQLDRGTRALWDHLLTGAIDEEVQVEWLVWTVMWYRLFNVDSHAEHAGFIVPETFEDRKVLYDYLRDIHGRGAKIFTNAHMTTGVAGEQKIDTYIRACERAWEQVPSIVQACRISGSATYGNADGTSYTTSFNGRMQDAFEALLPGYMIGRFVAYEMVCDLRFIEKLWPEGTPSDVFTWANMGPGAARGLRRLGRMGGMSQGEGLKHMRDLYAIAKDHVGEDIITPFKPSLNLPPDGIQRFDIYAPFELREIEHSLCEFDKMQRVLHGEGQPRMKFNGRA
jgi:hypothetical protein